MQWQDYTASLDAGATLADFFPELAEQPTINANADLAPISEPEPTAETEVERPTKRLNQHVLRDNTSRVTQMFYRRIECSDYGLGDEPVVRFKNRQPKFMLQTVEELGLSSFNFIDVFGDDPPSACNKVANTSIAKPVERERIGDAEGGHNSFARLLSREKSLSEKLKIVLNHKKASEDLRATWLRQQQATFAAYTEAQWAQALQELVSQHSFRVAPANTNTNADANCEEDAITIGDHAVHLMLTELEPTGHAAAACFKTLHLLTACFICADAREIKGRFRPIPTFRVVVTIIMTRLVSSICMR